MEGGAGPLFSRPTRVEPTMHAQSLYPKVKELSRVLDQVHKQAGNATANRQLKVGLPNGMASLLGLDFILTFEAAHLGAELQVNECSDLSI